MLAYATTIHKAQGSEYPAVVIPLTTQHYAMLARNLLYTGVTRGKKLKLKLPRFDGHPTQFRERCCHAENPSTVFTGVPSPNR